VPSRLASSPTTANVSECEKTSIQQTGNNSLRAEEPLEIFWEKPSPKNS
jgi:hypothetical protein